MAARSRDRLHFHATAKSVHQTRTGIGDATNCSLVCVQTLTKDIVYMGNNTSNTAKIAAYVLSCRRGQYVISDEVDPSSIY